MLQRAIHRAVRRAQTAKTATVVATRWISTTQALRTAQTPSSIPVFSQPSHFPEDFVAPGGGYFDELTAETTTPERAQEIYDQLKHDIELKLQQDAEQRSFDAAAAERFHLDPNLDEMAVNSFSEASTFPEFTPSEDGLFTQTHGMAPTLEVLDLQAQVWEAHETPMTLAQSALLDEMPAFSEPSDFPECAAVEEAIASRTPATGSG